MCPSQGPFRQPRPDAAYLIIGKASLQSSQCCHTSYLFVYMMRLGDQYKGVVIQYVFAD